MHCASADDRQAHGSEAQRVTGQTATANAHLAGRDGEVARASGAGVFPISRDSGQLGTTEGVPQRRAAYVVSKAPAEKPTQPTQLGSLSGWLGQPAAASPNTATVSGCAVRRQLSSNPRYEPCAS